MILLAVDTSTPQIGLSLYDGDQVLAESLWTSKARHTVELAPAVAELIEHAGIKIEQIDALGVAIGPGSFTSLRVGLSFIKGLAFSRSLPTIGIKTLDIVAASQSGWIQAINHAPGRSDSQPPLTLVCALPAGRGRLAVGWYFIPTPVENPAVFPHQTWQARENPVIMTAEALSAAILQDTIVCGDLNHVEREILKNNQHALLVSPALSARRPAILAELAYARWQAGERDDFASLSPLYLHLADPIPDPGPRPGKI